MTPDSTTTSIRFATRTDALVIAEMSRDLIEQGLGWSWNQERVLRSLRHPESNAIVAVRDNERAGFGIMKYGDDEAHLLLLAVRPGHARHGVGRRLVAWLEASARIAGIGRVTLEARHSNSAARAFYLELGYAQTQLLPGYYGGRETSVRMSKVLTVQPSENA
ncbi:MAG: GNAT family N-acetyltransferase [Pseudomonadota bacterium]|nr:GNAT family N-acetyltransferase [Pseudomonadota bacterium]